ncbi:MAG: transporter, partial [Roseibium sp.]|nr:transporter [Roseibium sp.]
SRSVILSLFHIGIAAIAAFTLTHVLTLDSKIESVIVLMCFMPPSVATYLAVSQHQPDEAHGVAGFIFVSTVLTLVTLPLVLTYWATG